MKQIYQDNPASVGNTPLVRLNRVVSNNAFVAAKIEGRNPSYSVKCRIGAEMIEDAEKKGLLKLGSTIIEPTSGNTGIGLAYAAAAKGYSLVITMPETMSIERRKILSFLGAQLILTPGAEGMGGAIRKAEEIAASVAGKYFMPQQFKNPANPAAHEKTTGPEIWASTGGKIDAIVAGVGTGGTITGISRYLKKTRGKNITSVAVEPASSPIISQYLASQPLKPGPHKIQGIGAGFIPETLDVSLLDRVEQVTDDEALEYSRRLAREEGILCGISSGAAVAAAARLSADPQFEGKTIVVILPDSADRYMSTALFDNV